MKKFLSVLLMIMMLTTAFAGVAMAEGEVEEPIKIKALILPKFENGNVRRLPGRGSVLL